MKRKITVVATIEAKPGKENAFGQALYKCMRQTHEETGCLHYSIHQSADHPTGFVTIERWEDRSDLDAHMQTPHLLDLLKRVPELVSGTPKIEVYHQLGEDQTPKERIE